ncbi:hypothetical protein F52700_4523 [Fusarium sp. NRRL 52700]|nr:hypothetical protein F52700_4523 [Fusarium sp. NRRL 52700]
MSPPDSDSKPMYIHTIWGRRPMSKWKRLLALLIPEAKAKLLNLVKKHNLHHMDCSNDELRLTVPLDNKTPPRALVDLAAKMEVEGMDKDWEFVAYILTDTPDELGASMPVID